MAEDPELSRLNEAGNLMCYKTQHDTTRGELQDRGGCGIVRQLPLKYSAE